MFESCLPGYFTPLRFSPEVPNRITNLRTNHMDRTLSQPYPPDVWRTCNEIVMMLSIEKWIHARARPWHRPRSKVFARIASINAGQRRGWSCLPGFVSSVTKRKSKRTSKALRGIDETRDSSRFFCTRKLALIGEQHAYARHINMSTRNDRATYTYRIDAWAVDDGAGSSGVTTAAGSDAGIGVGMGVALIYRRGRPVCFIT